jgi:hypothetical protein
MRKITVRKVVEGDSRWIASLIVDTDTNRFTESRYGSSAEIAEGKLRAELDCVGLEPVFLPPLLGSRN